MSLSMPKGKRVIEPLREPDMISKRGVRYWFSPEWTRDGTGAARIKAVNKNGSVGLYMLSKAGKLSYIQGSIQREFQNWYEEEEIDCILLGIDEEDMLVTDWEYEDV